MFYTPFHFEMCTEQVVVLKQVNDGSVH